VPQVGPDEGLQQRPTGLANSPWIRAFTACSATRKRIYLRPKTDETLLYLLQHQGRLITQNELLDGLG
jgi:DNA-binding winged helix-turn-helix (wHTH) protein